MDLRTPLSLRPYRAFATLAWRACRYVALVIAVLLLGVIAPDSIASAAAATPTPTPTVTGAGHVPGASGRPRAPSVWVWPVTAPPGRAAPVVVRAFAPPPRRWLAGERGVLLAAPTGAVVRAAGAGVVSYAGSLFGRGVVTVDHGPFRTTYLPVTPLVRRGQPVTAGEPIGTLAAAPLHWGLVIGHGHTARYLDPLSLLGAGPVRLLPNPPGRTGMTATARRARPVA
jgi:murein DD-endopeptidase MepM/ murein hydrolase activator NlpD